MFTGFKKLSSASTVLQIKFEEGNPCRVCRITSIIYV